MRGPVVGVGLGGQLRVAFADWEVREIDCAGRIAGRSDFKFSLSKPEGPLGDPGILPQNVNQTDRTAELRKAFLDGYSATPSPRHLIKSILAPSSLDALEVFLANPSKSKHLIATLPFGTGDITLRKVRGALTAALASVGGAGHVRLGKDGYGIFVSADLDFVEKSTGFGLSKEQITSILRFNSAGFCDENLEISVRHEIQEFSNYLADWNAALLSSISANSLTLSWQTQHSSLGLYRSAHHRYLIYKQNSDLPSLVAQVERNLFLPAGSIGYAGLKDKRAITHQWVSVPTVRNANEVKAAFESAGRSLGANSESRVLEVDGVEATGSEFDGSADSSVLGSSQKLKVGELLGNFFRIRIRGVQDSEPAQVSLASIRDHGFINYFGPQRFGFATGSRSLFPGASKHVLVGCSMLAREFDQAVKLFLSSDDDCLYEKMTARSLAPLVSDTNYDQVTLELFDNATASGSWQEALELLPSFPHHFQAQRLRVLKELKRGVEPVAALRAVPKSVLHLIPASVVSLLWNMAANEKAALFLGETDSTHTNVVLRNGKYTLAQCTSANEPLSLEPIFIPTLGIQRDGECPMLGLGINTREYYTGVVGRWKDQGNLPDITTQLLRAIQADPDLTEELGFNCRFACMQRMWLVKPWVFQWERQRRGERTDYVFSFGLPAGSYASSLLREVQGRAGADRGVLGDQEGVKDMRAMTEYGL